MKWLYSSLKCERCSNVLILSLYCRTVDNFSREEQLLGSSLLECDTDSAQVEGKFTAISTKDSD